MLAEAEKPNVILIVSDDLGYGDLGCYGQAEVSTPNLDRLAAEGVRFTQAYSGSAVCSPSRAVLMTGRHAGHASVRANTGGVPLPVGEATLASVLQQAGYTCGGFGKWGLGDVGTAGVPEQHGFQEFFGYYHQLHAHDYFPQYLWRNSERAVLSGNEDGARSEYSHSRIFAEMRRFIAENQHRPFFCYAPWTLPHGRYELPDSDPGWLRYKDLPWRHEERAAAAMIALIDRSVGQLLDDLDRLGIAERTLVLFTSDNGGSQRLASGVLRSNGRLRGGKASLYEGGIRVPLIARWPGIVPAATSDRVCYFGDFLPTLAELAGALVPEGLDGISFAGEIAGKSDVKLPPMEHEYLYWESGGVYRYTYPPIRAVRKGNWKGVIPAPDATLELYDLRSDEEERHNLSAECPEVAAELAVLIEVAHVPPPPQVEPDMPEGQQYR